MTAKNIKRQRWILITLGLLVSAGLAEWVARKTYVSGRHAVYERAEQLLEGWPHKEAFLRDRQGAFGHKGATYRDYYLATPTPLTNPNRKLPRGLLLRPQLP